jgi:transposase
MPPETLDSLDKDSLKPLVLQLLAQNKSLLERIDTLLVRIAELEGSAGKPPKTPTNSSLPPSTGQKAYVSETPRKRKGRKGRPGVTRTLADNPDATRDGYADTCACGTALSDADQPDVFAYDHIELPPIKPVTTRIHLHVDAEHRFAMTATARAASGGSQRRRRPTWRRAARSVPASLRW